MKIKFGAFWFFAAVAVSSFGAQQLEAMASDKTASVQKEIVLGHRVTQQGQVMLVTK